jgi:D-cysteine desulfhydrase family pyridoxal phosphate-dependent enzyme
MINRHPIAHLPTPVENLPRLTRALGGPRLLIKRDDQTGLAFGGNKTRKLEYLVADALARGADTLITTGAAQSNHCRQTAAAAARCGMSCRLVLVGPEPGCISGNLFLDHLVGAGVTWTTRDKRDADLQQVFDQCASEGGRPYLIPYGGSNPLGAAAYAAAIQELQAQHPDQKIDWIVFASSSGGTQAGLIAGVEIYGLNTRILGISVDEPASVLKNRVAILADETADLFKKPLELSEDDVRVNDQYLGEGYGVMGSPEREAVQLFARHEGILLDPVYTGRAAAGLMDLIRKDFFSPDEIVLFWHTGGTPGLFAEQYLPDLLK